MSHQQLISSILALPDAPQLLHTVNLQLLEERKRREAFYKEITDQEKVEFINGQIVIHSPVKKEHNDVASALHQLLALYVKKHRRGYVGYDKVMIALSRNDYEPDLCYFRQEKASDFQKGQTLFPVPDFVVEVLSNSTQHIDRGIKYQDYQAHRVLEYWIINADKEVLEQYCLDESGKYELILKASSGMVASQAIEGFQIPIEALFDDEHTLSALEVIFAA